MQRFLRLFACFALFVFAACGNPTTTNTPATAPVATEPVAAVTVEAPTEASTEAPTEAATATMLMEETATAEATESAEATASTGDTTTTAVGASGTLNVFAAASLTDAFGEIGLAFKTANPGIDIVFNFAGSQQLAQQIVEGAPVDVFASANATQMNVVIDAGNIITGTQTTFVRNRLVVIYPADNPAGIATLQDLAKPGLKLDLAAAEVPVGQYTIDFLDKAVQDPAFGPSFKDAVLANVVSYEENVRAVLTKVTLGEVDAGVVYSSDISQDAATEVGRLDIPDALNTIARYPIAPIQASPNTALAERFVAYVLSAEAQAVLAKYGFLAPQ